jgi:Fur family transcriptional regulator, stress-responsive regulator
MAAPDFPQRLRDAGLRVTAPRVAVLDVLSEHPHPTADRVDCSPHHEKEEA